MYKSKKVSVVIPAYNEQQLISKAIKSVPAFVDHIIVVDDSSTDKTIEVVDEINASNLLLIKHSTNMGVGKAIITGYKESLLLDSDIVVVMAGDAQMHPDDLQCLLEPILNDKANYSKGNRFIYSAGLSSMPKLRIVGNFCFSVLSCIASGYYHIFDTQCGYTAIDRYSLKRLDLDSLYARYGFPTDMLAKLNVISARVIDVPVRAIYDSEVSGIKPISYTLNIIRLSVRLFFERQIKKNKRELPQLQDI